MLESMFLVITSIILLLMGIMSGGIATRLYKKRTDNDPIRNVRITGAGLATVYLFMCAFFQYISMTGLTFRNFAFHYAAVALLYVSFFGILIWDKNAGPQCRAMMITIRCLILFSIAWFVLNLSLPECQLSH